MLESLLQFDQTLFQLINGEWHNEFLDNIMPYWRDKKSWIPFYVILIGFSLIKLKKQGLFLVLGAVLTIGVCDHLSSQVIKKNVERLRPCKDEKLKTTIEVRTLIRCGSGYSFTSSHATNHFGIATFLIFAFAGIVGATRYLLWLWAGTISYGQVYVGVHYPLDVIAGGILGCICGCLIYLLYKRVLRWDESRRLKKT